MRISDWSSDVCSSDLNQVITRIRGKHRLFTSQPSRRDRKFIPRNLRNGDGFANRTEASLSLPTFSFSMNKIAAGETVATGVPDLLGRYSIRYAAEKGVCLSTPPEHCRRQEERRVGKEGVSTCKYRW